MTKKILILSILLLHLTINAFSASMDGVTVGMDVEELFNVRGFPQFMGPALENIVDINSIISPPPFGVANMTKGSGGGGMGGSSPWSGGGIPTIGGGGMSMGSTGQEPLKPLGSQDYIIFLYRHDKQLYGKNYTPNYNTYIFIERASGSVLYSVVWEEPGKQPRGLVPPEGGITLGSTILQIYQNIGYPNNITQINDIYIYFYQSKGISYSVSTTTGKVVGIALANRGITMDFTKMKQTTSATQQGTTAGSTGTSSVPGQPYNPGTLPALSGPR